MTGPHANPEDLDLYALGALDGEEKQTLEAHLRACPYCQQQLAAARQRTALIGLAAPPVAPRPQVKSALMDKVRAEKRDQRCARKQSAQDQEKTLGPALLVGVWAGYGRARLCDVRTCEAGSRSRQAAQAASGTACAGRCGPPGHGPGNRRAGFRADYSSAATQRTSGTGARALQRAHGFGCLLRPNRAGAFRQELPALAGSRVGRARRCRDWSMPISRMERWLCG